MIGDSLILKFFFNSTKFSIKDFQQNLFIDNIFDSHLKLKRNVFNSSILNLNSKKDHQLYFYNNLTSITTHAKWEVWMIIQILMTFIHISQENSNLENPLSNGGRSIYYSEDQDSVYQICQIDDYKFSYTTQDFINTDLCNIVDNLTLNSNIKFIPYDNEIEAASIKFRYFGLHWGGIEYYNYLSKCL